MFRSSFFFFESKMVAHMQQKVISAFFFWFFEKKIFFPIFLICVKTLKNVLKKYKQEIYHNFVKPLIDFKQIQSNIPNCKLKLILKYIYIYAKRNTI
jgi:hypothetical protein